jgi:hypothetical protein
VKPVLDYCTQKNIPFKLEEDLYYKINKLNQMHNKFEININKCFETQRPSENDQGIELLKNFEDQVVQTNGKYVTMD